MVKAWYLNFTGPHSILSQGTKILQAQYQEEKIIIIIIIIIIIGDSQRRCQSKQTLDSLYISLCLTGKSQKSLNCSKKNQSQIQIFQLQKFISAWHLSPAAAVYGLLCGHRCWLYHQSTQWRMTRQAQQGLPAPRGNVPSLVLKVKDIPVPVFF